MYYRNTSDTHIELYQLFNTFIYYLYYLSLYINTKSVSNSSVLPKLLGSQNISCLGLIGRNIRQKD